MLCEWGIEWVTNERLSGRTEIEQLRETSNCAIVFCIMLPAPFQKWNMRDGSNGCGLDVCLVGNYLYGQISERYDYHGNVIGAINLQ